MGEVAAGPRPRRATEREAGDRGADRNPAGANPDSTSTQQGPRSRPDFPMPPALPASPSGRALQTLAVICEHIEHDWHLAKHDPRLFEINVGDWAGRTYAEIMDEIGPIIDAETSLFSVRAPGGEWYDEIAARLMSWINDTAHIEGDRLVLMHGMSSRVLRGLLLGLETKAPWNAPIAPSLPQGTMVVIENGVEQIVRQGGGTHHA